ncbi:5'/3'-nucleotidase SurE [bacterium]|nr:5'/3'-nucleotidase SurE [bacterium]
MPILVTNDDGIFAPGLNALVDELVKIDEVVIVAPDREQSSVGHAITLSRPLRITSNSRSDKITSYAVNGTPADAVKLALKVILKEKPSVLVSGINRGANTGTALIYSGTVSAATEGTMMGIPSIAISLSTYEEGEFEFAAKFARVATRLVLEKGLPKGIYLNINVPDIEESEIKGVKITKQGTAYFADFFEKRLDPRSRQYYWMAGTMESDDEDKNNDYHLVRDGYITITPVHYDLTAYPYMDELSSWEFEEKNK